MGVLIDKVSEITGEPIDKYFNIDFAGFSDFVDALGGIDVDVPESIIDREYPDNNWGYQTFKITRGFQTLDGATTLKYARSRHSTSDFDRSARQQLIIAAIKDKLVSLDAITNPKKLGKLYDSIATHLRTDLTLAELVDIAVFGAKLEASSILSYNINDGCYQGAIFCRAGGFLYTPERDLFGGLAVLLPDTATASKISAYRDIRAFSSLVCNTPEIFIQPRAISIVNASGETGLANTLAIKLRKYGFTVPERDALSSTKDLITTSRIHYLDSAIDPILGIPSDDPVFEALGSFVVAPIVATGALSYTQLVDSKIEIILSPDASTRISR
jgi:hypothetical protein